MKASEICELTRQSIKSLLEQRMGAATGRDRCRRDNVRWAFPGAVELWITDDDGTENHVLATSINLSSQGIGIRTDEPIKPGTEVGVAVHEPEMSLHGRAAVRHCNPAGHEFVVGLQFLFNRT